MKPSRHSLALVLALLGTSAGTALAQTPAYAVDSDLDQLFSIDLATGAATPIASTLNGGLTTPAGLAWRDDTQELWTIDLAGGELGTIDVQTGAFTVRFTTGLSGWQSIAWDPTLSLFFLSNQNGNFDSFDPATGTLTVLGTASYVSGMDVDANGTLWGIRFSGGDLYTIDKVTAALTLRSTSASSFGSLGIEQATGTFYACNATDDSLYRIDPMTGTRTLVGAHGAGITFIKGFELADAHCSGTVARLGTGCADASGTTFTMTRGGAPCLGRQLDLGASGGTQTSYFLVFGLSNTLWLGGILLPVDLGPFGAPGCSIYTSQELLLGPIPAGTPLPLPIGMQGYLVGARTYVQALQIDAAIPTPLPIATSDYFEITLGS